MGGGGGPRDYATYSTSVARERAMSVPTISRARDILASLIGAASLEQFTTTFDPTTGETVDVNMPSETWMITPDPAVTRSYSLAWLFDDLYFQGRAFWAITRRYATGFPAEFTWLPAADVQTGDQAGPLWYGPSTQITFNGMQLDPSDVVQFISPVQGLLSSGARSIEIARRLDTAAMRFASNEIPSGWLQAKAGGESLTGEELADLAESWAEARSENAIAALNEWVEWHETSIDPSKLQLAEARNHQALELARVANVPPYLVGVEVGGYTYQNAQQARADSVTFGARPFIDCIEQTLSSDRVLPRGRYVRLQLDRWLDNPLLTPAGAQAPATTGQEVPA